MWWGRGDTLMPASPVPRDCSHHLAGPAVTQGRACAPAGTLCASHLGDYTSDCPGATPREAPMSHLRASSGPGGHTWANRPPHGASGSRGPTPPMVLPGRWPLGLCELPGGESVTRETAHQH